jgi:hypothetical protein
MVDPEEGVPTYFDRQREIIVSLESAREIR